MIRHQKSAARAFTLIELLTVTAVIAVIVSILLPTAAKVKESTRRTMCADNMRQLMAAVLSYAHDNYNRGPMRGYFTYTVAERPREALGWSGPGSPELDLQGTLGSQRKLLVNLGQLYRKWIGGRHDMLYCPSFYDVRDATWTPGGGTSGNGGGWKSAFVSYMDCYWTFGGYQYGTPLSAKSIVGGLQCPPRSPDFSGPNPFPPGVWADGLKDWIQNTWQPRNPGKTFEVPSSPALAFDPWIGGFKSRHGGVNVMYTDGHVRFHDIGNLATSSGGSQQYEVWYQLSLKQ
jgi:prepilin-type N-terminal cleavage/methylation domain-containing protein/prepilin-type processing-associated H-X9-DG protein